MFLYNLTGIFHNHGDGAEDIVGPLKATFTKVEFRVVGTTLLFEARWIFLINCFSKMLSPQGRSEEDIQLKGGDGKLRTVYQEINQIRSASFSSHMFSRTDRGSYI